MKNLLSMCFAICLKCKFNSLHNKGGRNNSELDKIQLCFITLHLKSENILLGRFYITTIILINNFYGIFLSGLSKI